jgi:hypothetical protein
MAEEGLYPKYRLARSDGQQIPEGARFFVLRYDEQNRWGAACRDAVKKFADEIEFVDPELAKELRADVAKYDDDERNQ